jgi:hypothetical protein
VTKECANLANIVCREFDLEPVRVVWIEHYGYAPRVVPKDARTFDLVTFGVERRLGAYVLVSPRRRPMTRFDWESLSLPVRRSVTYRK